MNTGFTKLFSTIISSSIWSADDKTRIMWVTMMALADQNGYVAAALPGLADLARMSIEDAEKAVGHLEAPDKYSRTPDEEGRRILKVDGGWQLVNHAKYRGMSGLQDRREYQREYQRSYRKHRKHVDTVDNVNMSASASVSESSSSEGDARGTDVWTEAHVIALGDTLCIPPAMCIEFRNHYAAVGWVDFGGRKIVDVRAALAKWKANQPSHGKASPKGQAFQPSTRDTAASLKAAESIWDGMVNAGTWNTTEGKAVKERIAELKKQLAGLGG